MGVMAYLITGNSTVLQQFVYAQNEKKKTHQSVYMLWRRHGSRVHDTLQTHHMYVSFHYGVTRIIHVLIYYSDVIMGVMASQITSLPIVYSTVYQTQIKENIKLSVTGLCAGNSPVTDEFPAQMPSNADFFSIWWRHHELWYRVHPRNYGHRSRFVKFCCRQMEVNHTHIFQGYLN